jgi:hypothetical protein
VAQQDESRAGRDRREMALEARARALKPVRHPLLERDRAASGIDCAIRPKQRDASGRNSGGSTMCSCVRRGCGRSRPVRPVEQPDQRLEEAADVALV